MDALLPKIPCISDCFLDIGTEANLSPSSNSWELSPENPYRDRDALLFVSEDCEDDIALNPQEDYSRFWNHGELAIWSGEDLRSLVWLYSAVANTLAWHARDPEFEPRYSHFCLSRFVQVFLTFPNYNVECSLNACGVSIFRCSWYALHPATCVSRCVR